MPGEKPPPTAREETALLREEVALQKREAAERAEREARSEELKNRVSVAAIVLTTALSFTRERGTWSAAPKRRRRPSLDLARYGVPLHNRR